MEIICNTIKLKESLEHAERIVTRHLTLPILNNFLIKTEKNGIKILSTNLEIGVSSWFPCKVVKSGEITVPAKVFYSIISSLGTDKVSLEIKKDNILNILSDNYKATLKGENAKDFPKIPELNKETVLNINSITFCRSLSQLLSFVSNSETRPEITGILFYKNKGENVLFLVSTDSFRLGEKVISVDESFKDIDFSVIIPARTASEVVRIFSNIEGDISITLEKNQISFESNKTELISRLIEGNYPDYKKLIPVDFNTTAKLSKENFVKIIKLVSLLAGRVNDIRLSFVKNNVSKLKVYAADSDLGENDSEIIVDLAGESLEVKFNWKYLVDGVANFPGTNISLNFIDEAKPCLVKSVEDKTFLYLVMPIRS